MSRGPRATDDAADHLSVDTWDGYTADMLALRCGVPHLELFAETESTLDVAHLRAESGAAAGTVVLADRQTAGRGRQGRTWTSERGSGVWVTVLERPQDRAALDVLSLRIGLRLAEALDEFAGEQVGVKWPNDLVVAGGKIAGILVEARWAGASLGWVAVGVGVNVVEPPDVPGAAGLAGARRVDVLEAAVHAVRDAASVAGHLSSQELGRFARRDALRGRVVTSPARGTAAGIDASGALLITTARGVEPHRAGSVRLEEDS
jgi:BirA family biotin operon repressor/biotin-[acetyl-CoA-carboxylase] ligase